MNNILGSDWEKQIEAFETELDQEEELERNREALMQKGDAAL